jgi:hypothetical protein
MRDPIIEGHYYIGGGQNYQDWVVDTNEEVKNITPMNDYGRTPGQELPTQKIINLYEKVRNLPLFDTRQAPLMEMQYGEDGVLYFLQYLKTNRMVDAVPEFPLPEGDGVAHIFGKVVGATVPEGEKLRLYLEPDTLTARMAGQAIRPEEFEQSHKMQVASVAARIMITETLYFNHGHFDSAPFVRAPIAIGMDHHEYRDLNEPTRKLLSSLAPPQHVRPPLDTVTYIDTNITTNGREATIESDWQPKTEPIN